MNTVHTSPTPLFPIPAAGNTACAPTVFRSLLGHDFLRETFHGPPDPEGPPPLVLPQVLGLNFSSTCALGGRMWFTAGLRAAGLEQTIGL